MDIEHLKFKAACLRVVRRFFSERGYGEADVPCLSACVIPESSIEVFQTERTVLQAQTYYLLPSPELYLKKLLAALKCSLFSIAHAFRAGENSGRIHNSEFTMLEYYTVEADYKDSIAITEEFFRYLAASLKDEPLLDKKAAAIFSAPFLCMTMDEAFLKYARFSLAQNLSKDALLQKVKSLNITDGRIAENYSAKDLYEIVLVSVVEPSLPADRLVALTDYPVLSETLSKRKKVKDMEVTERWEVYLNGVELANCYTELTDGRTVRHFFDNEKKFRAENRMTNVRVPEDFAHTCSELPRCSGVALGLDRLLMLLTGEQSIARFMMTDGTVSAK